jgi:hypothetical protein
LLAVCLRSGSLDEIGELRFELMTMLSDQAQSVGKVDVREEASISIWA